MWAIAEISGEWATVISAASSAATLALTLLAQNLRARLGAPPSGQGSPSQGALPLPLDQASPEQLEAELQRRRVPAEQAAALTSEALRPQLAEVAQTNARVVEEMAATRAEIKRLADVLVQRSGSRTPSQGSAALSRDSNS